MGLSQRQYALHRGVSHTAVGKAVRSGRITLLPDGTIDPAIADRQWSAETDPTKQRESHGASGASPRAARARTEMSPESKAFAAEMAEADRVAAESGEAAREGGRAVPASAVEAVREALTDVAGGGGGASTQVTFLRAKTANEVIKAKLQQLKLDKAGEAVVPRKPAERMFYDMARRERDAWVIFPARVAANMAADLGVDAHDLEVALNTYIREYLSKMSKQKITLGGGE